MSEKKEQRNSVAKLVKQLVVGVSLIESLTDEIYTKSRDGVGSIGAHVRHNLDFVTNFLAGLESGRIDYVTRERDLQVEQNRQHAKERFLFLIERLGAVSGELADREVSVRSEIEDSVWHRSTGGRELEFVYSHTVHHYALIAEKLTSYGITVSPDFGVAPSTLDYWALKESKTKVA